MTVGGTTYTFQTAVAAAGDVKVGATANATLVNLANAINGTAGANNAVGGLYDSTANASATAVVPVGTTLTVSSLSSALASAANAVVLVIPAGKNTAGGIAVSGAGTLSGGVDATSTPTAVTNTLLTAAGVNPGANAQATLSLINAAISQVASLRGVIGANINRLQAASNVESVQVQNLTSAEDQITAANIPQQVTHLSEYSILNQSGISALAQANSAQQSILKLLQ